MNLNEIALVPKADKFIVQYMSKATQTIKTVTTSEKAFKKVLVEQHQNKRRNKRWVDAARAGVEKAKRQIAKMIDDCDFSEFMLQAQNNRAMCEEQLCRYMKPYKDAEAGFKFYMDQIDPDEGEYITLMMYSEDEWEV